MAFGMYICGRCAEYVFGNTINIEQFIDEHMCTEESMKAQRLEELKVMLEQPPQMLQRPENSENFPQCRSGEMFPQQQPFSASSQRLSLQPPAPPLPPPAPALPPPAPLLPPPPPPLPPRLPPPVPSIQPSGCQMRKPRAPLTDLNGRTNSRTTKPSSISEYFLRKQNEPENSNTLKY